VDRQWLQTLSDDPGRFLKLRLAAEHNRRVDAGTAPPITGDPW
jgi:Ca-activated chloride channel homolog